MQRKRHSRIPRSNKKWMHFLKHKKLVNARDIRHQLRLDAEHFFNVSDENGEESDDKTGPDLNESDANE